MCESSTTNRKIITRKKNNGTNCTEKEEEEEIQIVSTLTSRTENQNRIHENSWFVCWNCLCVLWYMVRIITFCFYAILRWTYLNWIFGPNLNMMLFMVCVCVWYSHLSVIIYLHTCVWPLHFFFSLYFRALFTLKFSFMALILGWAVVAEKNSNRLGDQVQPIDLSSV